MSEEEYMHIPWQTIFEICAMFMLSKEDFDRLTFDEFMEMYRQVMRGTI